MARNSSEVEQAVSRTLRDSLAKLQQTTGELDQAVNDLVSACASARPSNSLPPMLRARSAAASLAASLEVLSRFVITALQSAPVEPELLANESLAGAPVVPAEPAAPAERIEPLEPVERMEPVAAMEAAIETAESALPAEPSLVESPTSEPPLAEPPLAEPPLAEPPAVELIASPAERQEQEPEPPPPWEPEPTAPFVDQELAPAAELSSADSSTPALSAASYSEELPPEAMPEAIGFDLSGLAHEERELHRRANRVAKVSMQDVKMLRPADVALGKEHKDLCIRLRDDIEKAHKEYDRRFHAIMDQPVDYFYDWMVQILGDGDPETLGEYPYPSPVLRR